MYFNEAESSQDTPSEYRPLSQKSSVDVAKIVARTFRQTDSTLTKLHVMTEEFAARLSERTLSGAEIQGLLLNKKLDPQEALATMNDWVKQTLAAKDKQKPGNTAEDWTSSSDTKKKGARLP